MNLRWLFFDYLDPSAPLDRADRRAVMEQVRRNAMAGRRPPKAIAFATLPGGWTLGRVVRWYDVLVAMVPATVMLIVFWGWLRWGSMAWNSIALMVGLQMLLTWVTIAVIGRFMMRPWIALALHDLGMDACWRCGYWLDRGTGASPCPECGAARLAEG